MKKIFYLIWSDWLRYVRLGGGKKTLSSLLFHALSGKSPSFAFCFWLRLASRPNLFRPIAILKCKLMSRKYGLQISYKMKIGRGLYLGHAISIVINARTVIGNNFSISHMNSIGTDKKQPAIIGDNVIVGPMACLVNGVHIGNNVKIGAGAVVVKDIPDDCTAVGNPVRIINNK